MSERPEWAKDLGPEWEVRSNCAEWTGAGDNGFLVALTLWPLGLLTIDCNGDAEIKFSSVEVAKSVACAIAKGLSEPTQLGGEGNQ